MALLGEIAPYVTADHGHHRQIRDHLVAMLVRHGFPRAAREVAERSLSAVKEWAATHPQRDEARFCLGAAHDTCGQARLADGQPVAAEAVLAVAVDIYHELAAEHPTFIEADQRLANSLQHLGEVHRALDLPEHKDKEYEIWSECSEIRARLFQANTSPGNGHRSRPGLPAPRRSGQARRRSGQRAEAAEHPPDDDGGGGGNVSVRRETRRGTRHCQGGRRRLRDA
ncbi:hypothetical protein [Actinomadura chokoriensis]|uniref:Tetratricopeptide repeat protein n=1 Tax=Actinomadura chokoriensis TaxID=454156 RepID=A0ABV4QU24_9ACTN